MNADEIPLGTANYNPLLDTHAYQVHFDYGRVQQYSINTIHDNLCSQVDSEFWDPLHMSDIVDNFSDGTSEIG